MGVGSGLGAQFGFSAAESPVGTAATVTRFAELNSESLKLKRNVKEGLGLRAGGLYPRGSRRVYVSRDAGGDVEIDLPQKGLGLLLQPLIGSYGATAVQQASTTAYRQIHTDGTLQGKTHTFQIGRPSTDGTVNPFTYPGGKISGWELSCAQNDIAKLKFTVDAFDEQPTGAGALGLQAATYTNPGVFSFKDGAVLAGGTVATSAGLTTVTGGTAVAQVRGFSLKGSNPLKTDRWFFGGNGLKSEQLENGYRAYTGQLDAEFSAMTQYGQYAADTSFALQLNFVGSLISTPYAWTLAVVIPMAFWEDTLTPNVGGPDIVMQPMPFKVYDDGSGTNPRLQIVYTSTDTTV